MGEAKRRGTREERVVEAVARRAAWDKRMAEKHAALLAERRRVEAERLKLMSTLERKEAVLIADDRLGMSALLHALLASSVPPYLITRRDP